MSFIEDLRQKCLTESNTKFSDTQMVSRNIVPIQPLLNLSNQILIDLNLPGDTSIAEIEDVLWKFYTYMFHKGIAVAIASRYGRDNIEIGYSYKDAQMGKILSYQNALIHEVDEYSFNIRYHLLGFDYTLEEIYGNIYQFIDEHKLQIIEEKIDVLNVVGTFLSFAGLLGIEFTNRILLTKDDYWPIRRSIIINDSAFADDSDLFEIDRSGEFEETLLELEDKEYVRCPFCGLCALELPKNGDVLKDAVSAPCEHLAFGFITNAGNFLYGRDYYKRSFKKAVIDYVETYKGFTCENNPEAFINDFLNDDTDLNNDDMSKVIQIVKSDLPDFDLKIKKFEKIINNTKHVFLFHFIKFIKPIKNNNG